MLAAIQPFFLKPKFEEHLKPHCVCINFYYQLVIGFVIVLRDNPATDNKLIIFYYLIVDFFLKNYSRSSIKGGVKFVFGSGKDFTTSRLYVLQAWGGIRL